MMAKSRKPKCPKVVDPAKIVRATVMTLFNGLFPGGDPEAVMGKLRGYGAHHRLMELAYPETDSQEGMEYGGSLDEFEGELASWLDDAAAGYAEHHRRMEERIQRLQPSSSSTR
jgi:hypothetical protein